MPALTAPSPAFPAGLRLPLLRLQGLLVSLRPPRGALQHAPILLHDRLRERRERAATLRQWEASAGLGPEIGRVRCVLRMVFCRGRVSGRSTRRLRKKDRKASVLELVVSPLYGEFMVMYRDKSLAWCVARCYASPPVGSARVSATAGLVVQKFHAPDSVLSGAPWGHQHLERAQEGPSQMLPRACCGDAARLRARRGQGPERFTPLMSWRPSNLPPVDRRGVGTLGVCSASFPRPAQGSLCRRRT